MCVCVSQFMAGPAQRARYFARSFFGWHEFSNSQPSGAHEGLARLVRNGWVSHIITQVSAGSHTELHAHVCVYVMSLPVSADPVGLMVQTRECNRCVCVCVCVCLCLSQNVDRLHHKAGTPSDRVLELHGTTHE